MKKTVNVTERKKPIRSLRAPAKLARRSGAPATKSVYRSEFMRDRDRVLYSSAFRMLAGKTQVYITGIDDNMRTRLTHTLEVAQIAKTIAANLLLDVDLVEAIALAHDIGHTPYGHAGERILHTILNPMQDHPIKGCPFDISIDAEYRRIIENYSHLLGFKHNLHSVEVAITEAMKTQNQSLSLTNFALYGMKNHSSLKYDRVDGEDAANKVGYYDRYNEYCLVNKHQAWSFEAFVVEEADEIAQRHHDLEDAIRGKLITPEQVYNQLKKDLYGYFTSSDKRVFRNMNKAVKNNDRVLFFAELSRLIVNLLVTRLVKCSIYNLNAFIEKNSILERTFVTYMEEHDETEVRKLIGYDYVDFDGDLFADALKRFKTAISRNVLDAYDIQRADAKGVYIIRKLVHALYTTPQQLTDDSLIEYGVACQKYGYNDIVQRISREGIGGIRKECIEDIVDAKAKLYSDNRKVDEQAREKLIVFLRTICNYIASMTDRSLQLLYQELYG